ncbi:hypothetical protein GCM10007880_38050 [Mesorhizobium amorphae]|nr:hypothetical protein GCM10007880_38050 [Mesorhizobium amorphae]
MVRTAWRLPACVEQAEAAEFAVHGAGDVLAFGADVAQLAIGEILDILVGDFLVGEAYGNPGMAEPVKRGTEPGRPGGW